ncbi:MAG: RnfABCDGE type electron transport complex subunit G [Deltaproteobacteria bacterium]|nr:RnfABCDGE type electron transport complex subunit G [Deltaproteobacteria bacterium]MBW2353123.1 RnfABCDGE type electron transport complex subunit G [Deltaproteobacteria bacterium]HDZ89807.1 RnfABCDGE type electron transport complex subunit G [Deltaproteobacteria bacterium]
MREMLKLFIAVVVFSCLSGGVLAAIQNFTKERIEYQQLKFVKGPAIKSIMEGCSNDPLSDRLKIADKDKEMQVFIGEFDGRRNTVAFETFGKGFGGAMGVIVGVNLENDEIVGVGVTTHSETPGVGSKAKTDPEFTAQFKGLSLLDPFKVKADGGEIDALSGATISSRGVCGAVVEAGEIYKRLKPQLLEKIKQKQG